MNSSIAVIIINYQTPDLLVTAVESFRSFYRAIPLLIVDNGSKDQSRSVIRSLVEQNPDATSAIELDDNIFHGPAMDYAVRQRSEDYLFFLDSDTRTIKGEFLEQMSILMESSEKSYAAGRVDILNKRGFISPTGTVTAVRTPYMLIDREKYLQLHPFIHHGMPTIRNFIHAKKSGYLFHHFPIQEYIEHSGRGTAGKFGYQLGVKGKINYILNRIGL